MNFYTVEAVPNQSGRTSWLDVGFRFLGSTFFAACAANYLWDAGQKLYAMSDDGLNIATFNRALAMIAVGAYAVTLTILFIFRRPSISRFAGWPAGMVAMLGCFLPMGMIFLTPRIDLPLYVGIISSLLILTGNALTVYCLMFLGKSFSILPAGRALITSGPYRFVRHPVYMVEAVATLGVLINFWSPAALLLVFVQLSFQFLRLCQEERVLEQTFPEYKSYARRTARLIPGIY